MSVRRAIEQLSSDMGIAIQRWMEAEADRNKASEEVGVLTKKLELLEGKVSP